MFIIMFSASSLNIWLWVFWVLQTVSDTSSTGNPINTGFICKLTEDIWIETKWLTCCRWYFHVYFFDRKCLYFGLYFTEALKGHRVVWKIEIYYLIRMTYEWKSMSSGWHNNIVVTHPDEIPISAKSSGWHMVVWYVIRMTYCSVQKSSGWDTARS